MEYQSLGRPQGEMLRNQVIDPESPERRGLNPNNNLGVKVSPPTEYEDPWYAASNDNSPRNNDNGGVTGSFGNSSSYGGGSMGYGNDAYGSMASYDDYDNEPPLLEELGVNFDHVYRYV